MKLASSFKTVYAATMSETESRIISIASISLLVASIALYALLVNMMAGEEYGIKKLSNDLDRIESEIARSQAVLLKGTLEGTEIAENSKDAIMMQDIGSDLHYLRESAVFVEAPKPTP